MGYSLIVDWLFSAQGADVLSWWLLVTLAGAAAWPLMFRVMGGLPDRGYTLARAAGLMLTGFVFWFLASLGLLRNTTGGMVVAWLIVLALGGVAYARWDSRPALRDWVREHRGLIILTELLFFVLLFGWSAFRAHYPEMFSTEKPMEIMFLNSIRASDTFPPRDAWLSGYAISYYYFGYVIMAMLSDLSGVTSGVGFNITIGLLFSLTAIGALGVVYNMVRARGQGMVSRRGSPRAALLTGLLGACFVVFFGGLGTALVELPYFGHAPWLASQGYFDFWDVEGRYTRVDAYGNEIKQVPDSDNDTIPNWDEDSVPVDSWGFMGGIGWRYSRVVRDRDLTGRPHPIQPITEVPVFSFILADNHPHVLALPFAMLALGLMLNLVQRVQPLRGFEVMLYAIFVGGMAFMNSWDAIYLPLLIGAFVLRRLVRRGTGTLGLDDIKAVLRFAVTVIAWTVFLYLPWLLSFTSQAGGVLPNVIYPTRWQQYFLQFGIFLLILVPFLIVEARRAGRRFHWQAGLLAATMALSAALILVVALGLRDWGRAGARFAVYSVFSDAGGLGELLPDILAKRAGALPSELLLLGMIALVVARLFARPQRYRVEGDDVVRQQRTIDYSPATGFALLLAGAGVVLTFGPDFVYLQDNFSVRINTVFKLYYQGWLMFSLASAFAVWSLLSGGHADPAAERDRMSAEQPLPVSVIVGRGVFGALVGLLVVLGLLYPLIASHGRALIDSGRAFAKEQQAACEAQQAAGVTLDCNQLRPLTLDGTPTMVGPDELAAIQCLSALEVDKDAVLVEAPGGAYEPHMSRFSGLTGIPTLIGWQNHERQWRGSTYARVTDWRFENGQQRDRASDVWDLYTTPDWTRAWQVIDRYGIDYIVVGHSERLMIEQRARQEAEALTTNPDEQLALRESYEQLYQEGLNKFGEILFPVCQSGDTSVYRIGPS